MSSNDDLIIRWMGAFRKEGNLLDSIQWEFNGVDRECAAELLDGDQSMIRYAKVGVLIDPRKAIKSFTGDCWSVVGDDGKLKMTRNPRHANGYHREVWIRPKGRLAIVIKGRVSGKIRVALRNLSKKLKVPLFYLRKEGLVPQQ